MSDRSLGDSKNKRLSDSQRLTLQKRISKALNSSYQEEWLEVPRHLEPQVSFFQQGIWFLQQLLPEDTTYNRPVGVHISGNLNQIALQQACDEIFRRHEVLRWTYHFGLESIAAKTHPPAPLEIKKINLEEVSTKDHIQHVQTHYKDVLFQPFDLAKYPLVKAFLFQVAPQDHLFIIVFHHIAFDAWSERVFLNELVALYRHYAFQEPNVLPPLEFQYAHYAHWLSNKLDAMETARLAEFWEKVLSPLPPFPELSECHNTRPLSVGETWIERRTLPYSAKRKLQKLCQEYGMTPFVLLLSVCYLLLYRQTRASDLVVGVPFALRKPAQSERLIGLFINTLPLRGDLSGNPSVAELLSRVRNLMRMVHAHQDMPLSEIVKVVRPERSRIPIPLFEVIFNLKSMPQRLPVMHSIQFEPFEVRPRHTNFTLNFEILDNDQSYDLVLISDRSKISQRTTAQLASDYLKILQIILDDSSMSVQDVIGF